VSTIQPDIQHQLKHELVEQGLGDRLPTFADVQSEKTPRKLLPQPPQQLLPAADSIKCAVLDAVVHESLRCANTAGAVTRSATQDTTILGKFIPKGTTIYVPLSLVQSSSGHQAHSDEARSESSKATKKIPAWDPKTVHEFEPSRWLVDGRFDSKAGPWMPFSLGPRGCYGRALAVSHRLYETAQGTLIVPPRNRFSSSSSSSLKSHSRSSSSRSQNRSNLWIMSSLSLANPRSPTSVRDRGSRPIPRMLLANQSESCIVICWCLTDIRCFWLDATTGCEPIRNGNE
jgi:hypothetical protein